MNEVFAKQLVLVFFMFQLIAIGLIFINLISLVVGLLTGRPNSLLILDSAVVLLYVAFLAVASFAKRKANNYLKELSNNFRIR